MNDLQRNIAEGEHQQQDFKHQITDSRKIARTLSAFANTDGGRLLIGVKDNGNINGVNSHEEIHMVEAAADFYSIPNIEVNYQHHKIDGKEAVVLLQKYTLQSEAKATQRVKFFDAYGAYVINYNWGKDIVKNWIEAGSDQSQEGRWKRFSKLLSSPRLPATLD